MELDCETLSPGKNFCSVVTRKLITFKKRKRSAICKKSRSAWERGLLKKEISFYSKLLPLFNIVNKLYFSGEKICPTFFKGVTTSKDKSYLLIEDLRRYRTKENLQLSDLHLVLRKLAVFHAIGFLLKTYLPRDRFSERKSGDWCTVIHGDCWARNLMFRARQHMKFIDFGFFRHGHCLVDLIYLLFTSTQILAVGEVCEYYQEHLRTNLRKLGLDLDLREFRTELSKTATTLLPLATKVIKTIKTGSAKRKQLDHLEFVRRQLQHEL